MSRSDGVVWAEILERLVDWFAITVRVVIFVVITGGAVGSIRLKFENRVIGFIRKLRREAESLDNDIIRIKFTVVAIGGAGVFVNEASIVNDFVKDDLWHLSYSEFRSVTSFLNSVNNSSGDLSKSEFVHNIVSCDWLPSDSCHWHVNVGGHWFTDSVAVDWVVVVKAEGMTSSR